MKKLMVMVFILLFGSQALAAEKVKIGVVNLQRALNESKVGQKTKSDLEKIIKQKRAAIDKKIKANEKRKSEFERQAAMLSEEARGKRVVELRRLERNLERSIAETNAELQKLQREKEMDILKNLHDIIGHIGKQEGYAFILPADMVLYSVKGADLTDRVIKEYDRSKGKGAGKTKK